VVRLATTGCEVPWPVTTVCGAAGVPLTTGTVRIWIGALPTVNKSTVCT
jgi:hypothetical protein